MRSKADERLGEKRLMNCGEYATIIGYKSNKDIDIRFESGTIVKHRLYDRFTKGEVGYDGCMNSNKRRALENQKKRIGEKKLMNCGEYATITEYRSTKDIDVIFESGNVVKHKQYHAFCNGEIGYDGCYNERYKQKILGETVYQKYWEQNATIIDVADSKNITVQLEDGTILTSRYIDFQSGEVSNKNRDRKKHRIGESKMQECGILATIIENASATDVLVEFENGFGTRKTTYDTFKKGKVLPISMGRPKKDKAAMLGMKMKMNCGMEVTITEYNSYQDMTVTFEDEVTKKTTYQHFKECSINHPDLNYRIKNKNFHNFEAFFAWKEEINNVYYKCVCRNCGLKDIMTPTEMIKHEKECKRIAG